MKKTPSNYFFDNIQLRRLILPLMVEQLLSISVGAIDTIMVSSVGENAVSGLALVETINILLINIFAALATGGAVVASQYLGQDNARKARDACKQLLFVATGIAIVVAILVIAFEGNILRAIFGDVGKEIMQYAMMYFFISALGYPFIALYNGGAAIFRSMGNSRISMRTSLLMNGLNVCGNTLFIFGFGWGVAGAALSTLLSRIIGSILITRRLNDQSLPLYVTNLKDYRFDWTMVKRILSIAIPSGFENGIFQGGKIIVQSLVSTFGAASIAANAVIGNFSSFMIVPGAAIGLAMIPVVGRCVGANDYVQAKYYIRKLMLYGYLTTAASTLLFVILKQPMFQLYSLSAETMKIADVLIMMMAVGNILMWNMSFAFPNALRASNDAKFTMVVSIVSMFTCRVFLAYMLTGLFHLRIEAVYIGMLVDWLFRSTCFILRYRSGKWMNRKLLA